MAVVKKFEDLDVWKTSRQFTLLVYELGRQETFSKDHGLKDQICRSAVSIMSNIYELADKTIRQLYRFMEYLKNHPKSRQISEERAEYNLD